MKNKGAFEKAVEYIISKDMNEKQKLIKYIIDNDIPITGQELVELTFRDLNKFVKKFNKTINRKE